MFYFSPKKIWLYLLLPLLFSSTLQADRMKSLNDYFSDVEKSAKQVSDDFDALKRYMDEIEKTDAFIGKYFSGNSPKWHFEEMSELDVSSGYIGISTHTYTQGINDWLKKDIRGLLLEEKYGTSRDRKIELDFSYIEGNSDGENILTRVKKLLKNRNFTDEKINIIINNIKEEERKINFLIKNNIFIKISNIITYVEKSSQKENFFLNFIKKYTIKYKQYSPIDNNLEALEKNIKMSRSELTIHIHEQSEGFSILNSSKSDLYNKQNKFISIFDEYEKQGFCKKTILRHGVIKYESLRSMGKYNGYITYDRKQNLGTWVTPISSTESRKDLISIIKLIQEDFRNFEKIVNKYRELIIEKNINQLSSQNNKGLGNEF